MGGAAGPGDAGTLELLDQELQDQPGVACTEFWGRVVVFAAGCHPFEGDREGRVVPAFGSLEAPTGAYFSLPWIFVFLDHPSTGLDANGPSGWEGPGEDGQTVQHSHLHPLLSRRREERISTVSL